MNFDLTEEQQMAVASFRRFLETEIRPTVALYGDMMIPKPVAHDLLAKMIPLFRDARMITIPDGTTEIQKLIIARNLLGIAAFGERPQETK